MQILLLNFVLSSCSVWTAASINVWLGNWHFSKSFSMIGCQWSILDKFGCTSNKYTTRYTHEHKEYVFIFPNDAINFVACHASISETHQEKFMQHSMIFIWDFCSLVMSFEMKTIARLPNIDSNLESCLPHTISKFFDEQNETIKVKCDIWQKGTRTKIKDDS